MKTLQLSRHSPIREGTFGSLLVDGKEYCVTVENKDKLFPPGTYFARRFQSSHNGDCYLLSDKEGGHTIGTRDMIEIHRANFPHELRGCVAPGSKYQEYNGKMMVIDSKVTLARMFADFPDGFMLEVLDETS